MAVSAREQRILILAGLVGAVFVVTQIVPAVQGLYQRRNAEIETVLLAVEREARLIEDSLLWRDRRIEAEVQQTQVETQIFSGATIPLVEANLQRDLSKHARDSGLSVSSTRLADSLQADDWLMVSQEMSSRTDDAGNTITFLRLLENSEPRLRVMDFSLSRSRNQYNGSITVVGFAENMSRGDGQ
ncbi:MAG: hypothetical protein ACO3K8_10540 [Pseudohongiellaceae bacterium]